jgi:carboxyl-terminal processing protease
VALGAVVGVGADEVDEDLVRRDLESFDYVWQTIHDIHWDPELGGVDWQAVRNELRPQVEAATSVGAARSVLRDLVGRLGQSHFDIIAADTYDTLAQPGEDDGEDEAPGGDGTTGIDIRVVAGTAVVTSVDPGSPAAAAGVRTGWVVDAVDDVELAPIIARVDEEGGERRLGDELLLTFGLRRRIEGGVGDTLTLRFLDADDRVQVHELVLEKQKGKRARLGHLPASAVWIESRMVEPNVGYVAFNLFLDPATLMARFAAAVQSFMNADGVVIDLRGNPGGIGGMAMGMAGWFVGEKGTRLGTMVTRDAELDFVVFPRLAAFDGPLAVLVDGLSASTAEILAGGLQDLGRARVFGSRTAGMALPSRIDRLANGDGFQYAIANYVSAGGQPLEGRGVIPDEEVPLTREVLLSGRDPVLDAAVEWIESQGVGAAAAAR